MPATNAWLLSRFLSSPGWRRIRSRQTSRVSAGSSASGPMSSVRQPGIGAVDARRQEIDLAHLRRIAVADLGRASSAGQPGGPARPRGRVRAVRRRAARTRSTTAVFDGSLSPAPPAGTGRSASGCTRSRSRSRSISRNLPRRRIAHRALPDERRPARPACRARRAARAPSAGRPDGRPARRGARRRPRSDRAARARRGIVAAERRC